MLEQSLESTCGQRRLGNNATGSVTIGGVEIQRMLDKLPYAAYIWGA